MTIDPIISRFRSNDDRSRPEPEKRTFSTSSPDLERSEPRTDQIYISMEARALSGDKSLDEATLDRFQRLARHSIEQVKKSEEQVELVKSLLGLGI